MKVFKPPTFVNSNSLENGLKIFLAGSIEMGKAEDWQTKIAENLKDYKINIFNPRRDEWDSSWKQELKNEKFRTQVLWELKYLEEADIVIFYIQGDTKSPISIGEIYMMSILHHINRTKMIVCCEENFWRRGNIEIQAYKFNFPLVSTLDELNQKLKEELEKFYL